MVIIISNIIKISINLKQFLSMILHVFLKDCHGSISAMCINTAL